MFLKFSIMEILKKIVSTSVYAFNVHVYCFERQK